MARRTMHPGLRPLTLSEAQMSPYALKMLGPGLHRDGDVEIDMTSSLIPVQDGIQ